MSHPWGPRWQPGLGWPLPEKRWDNDFPEQRGSLLVSLGTLPLTPGFRGLCSCSWHSPGWPTAMRTPHRGLMGCSWPDAGPDPAPIPSRSSGHWLSTETPGTSSMTGLRGVGLGKPRIQLHTNRSHLFSLPVPEHSFSGDIIRSPPPATPAR